MRGAMPTLRKNQHKPRPGGSLGTLLCALSNPCTMPLLPSGFQLFFVTLTDPEIEGLVANLTKNEHFPWPGHPQIDWPNGSMAPWHSFVGRLDAARFRSVPRTGTGGTKRK